MRVLIVDANSAGIQCAARLRRGSDGARIILVDGRADIPEADVLRGVYNIDLRLNTILSGHYPNLALLTDVTTGQVVQEQIEHLCHFQAEPANFGRVRADEILGLYRPQHPSGMPLRQYYIGNLECAEIGMNEQMLTQAATEYIYSILPIDMGFLKLLYNGVGSIYGFEAVGHGITRYVDAMVAALAHGASVLSMTGLEMYGGDMYLARLSRVAQNVIEGRAQMAYPDQIPDFDHRAQTMLDVREPEELAMFYLPEAVNIPLSRLREEYHALDPNKEIILISQKGKRAYIASRILAHKGYKTSILTGGIDYYVYTSPRSHGI
ncbi:MAG: rhodanese-like domain-containing protein [Defluviitaleaceae bacterium]|nr:rhodanese-like domain-containing protein [Defluviitaleaceae bacterium]